MYDVNNNELFNTDQTFNLLLLNFYCMIVLYFINFFAIVIFNNFESEADFMITSPDDFTLIISEINFFENFEKLKESLTINEITPYEINCTFKISEYFEMKQQFVDKKNILRIMHAQKVSFI